MSTEKKSLSETVKSEVQEIRNELQIGDYLEEDGYNPVDGIATYVEEINGTKVGFIKYRAVGVVGKAPVMPRTTIHAIFIKKDRVFFVHSIVLFAGHQEEVRADQITIIKGLIEALDSNEKRQ